MTGALLFIAGFGGASLIGLLAWTFASSVRDLRAEDAMLAAAADDQQAEAAR
ncbi:hypothetical protein LOK46_13695 [Methylobacterium sp. NMS14P]|uniref:hypothetical protein n=1 Tax=Methylobacterium sp. NMS14P TaxID=2894310 RepID=UPI0023589FBB|nr:hypothetical protein [Methylobacterium sp. NMS14P]WCS27829.1 hypothetical protein LOK46_13695 [Methylobacterium sp. NMS14P]